MGVWNMIKRLQNLVVLAMLILAAMPGMVSTTTRTNRLMNSCRRLGRPGFRPAVSVLFSVLLSMCILLSLMPLEAQAEGGAYTIKWYAADPALNKAPYLPTYDKQPPASLACPGTGRFADPLTDAVAYGPTFIPSDLDAVTSLAPKDLALGQIVPFEVEIAVSGSTSPENGVITFTSGWNTHTTNSGNFGYDPTYMVYCAFIDTDDLGTIDPGNDATVDSFTTTLANPDGGSTEEIQGTFQISGLDDGDNVIVEIWVVLKPTIPPGTTGNVQTSLISAQTVSASPETINTGMQTVPLLRVKQFFSNDADVSVTKTDSPDPVTAGEQLTYSIEVTNNAVDVIANGVVVTDTLDPYTNYVSATGATCSVSGQTVTCDVGALSPGQSVTIDITVDVQTTAPTDGTTQTGTCTVGQTGVDLCNAVSVTALNDDPDTANNQDSEPTDVEIPAAPEIAIEKTADPTTSVHGGIVIYSYTVTNPGNVPLENVGVSDDKCSPSSMTFTGGDEDVDNLLDTDEIWTYECSYTVGTHTDDEENPIINIAEASGTYLGSTYTDTATATVDIIHPAIAIDKQPDSLQVVSGGSASFDLLVTNTGDVPLSDVVVADTECDAAPAYQSGDTNADGNLDLTETWTYTCSIANVGDTDFDN
ncbi:MAG: DUF11 domain-containing protein, partial [Methanosarcinaceae archaeon]|nr:DUF11 domain-containing protein [Methanosarcinaceae archaeon]